ncbi:hypothetical protein ACS0TY_003951 [Phlomoides rotata]
MVTFGSYEDRIDNLPGQPDDAPVLNQYGGYITVDETEGRSLFYYFVEALEEPYSKPLLLWLGEGRGCSSLVGAMTGIGPFGVNPDGYTLYTRNITWNKEYIDILTGICLYQIRTYIYMKHEDIYVMLASQFLIQLQTLISFLQIGLRDFLSTKTGTYISLERATQIGNGFLNTETDNRGRYHFIWSHALISDDAYENLSGNCSGPCVSKNSDIGMVNPLDIYGPMCGVPSAFQRAYDPCEVEYVEAYLNMPHVQNAINANKTKLPYTWEICSGDTDTVVPVTSTRYSLYAMGLKVLKPWIPWNGEVDEVAGYQVVYEGLTFATVRGAGHSIPRMQSARAFALLKRLLIMK